MKLPKFVFKTARIFEQLEVKKNDLKDADIEVKVLELNLPENPELIQTYQIKGKLIIMDEDKLDGYKIVIMAATETNSENQPEYIPVAFTNSESNGYFITSHIHFPHAEDLYNVIAAKALISKDEEHYEFPVKLVKTVITPPEGDVIQRTMLPRRLIIVIDKEAEAIKRIADVAIAMNSISWKRKFLKNLIIIQ